jgi:hypothetical protein
MCKIKHLISIKLQQTNELKLTPFTQCTKLFEIYNLDITTGLMTMISNVIMLNKLTDDIIVTIFTVLTTANKHVSTLYTTFLTL